MLSGDVVDWLAPRLSTAAHQRCKFEDRLVSFALAAHPSLVIANLAPSLGNMNVVDFRTGRYLGPDSAARLAESNPSSCNHVAAAQLQSPRHHCTRFTATPPLSAAIPLRQVAHRVRTEARFDRSLEDFEHTRRHRCGLSAFCTHPTKRRTSHHCVSGGGAMRAASRIASRGDRGGGGPQHTLALVCGDRLEGLACSGERTVCTGPIIARDRTAVSRECHSLDRKLSWEEWHARRLGGGANATRTLRHQTDST